MERFDTTDIVRGMQVVGADGADIGHVKDVDDRSFVLDRMMKRDLHVPFSAVAGIRSTAVVLTVRGDDVDDMDWEKTSFLGEPEESDTALGEPEDRVTGIGDPTERGTWSPAADAYDLNALDSVEERQAVEGRDEGGLPTASDPEAPRRIREP